MQSYRLLSHLVDNKHVALGNHFFGRLRNDDTDNAAKSAIQLTRVVQRRHSS